MIVCICAVTHVEICCLVGGNHYKPCWLRAQVLSNLEQFSRAPDFFTFCVASVRASQVFRAVKSAQLSGSIEKISMLHKLKKRTMFIVYTK